MGTLSEIFYAHAGIYFVCEGKGLKNSNTGCSLPKEVELMASFKGERTKASGH